MSAYIDTKHFEKTTKIKLGRCIQNTWCARLYAVKDCPNRVVKISVDQEYQTDKIISLLRKLKTSKNPSVVKIFSCGKYGAGYYYVMEKLKPLPSSYDSHFVNAVDEYYKSAMPTPIFSREFINFIANANKIKEHYSDIHEGNIMIDNSGNYKFVDVESFLSYQ